MAKKKHRNENGDICYVFNWEGGGGNHVYAHSKRGALVRAKLLGKGTHNRDGYRYKEYNSSKAVLVPVESSIRSVTLDQLVEFDRGLYLMTI